LALSATKIQGACLSAANEVDMKVFHKLWKTADWRGIEYLIADKGYDYSAVRTTIRKVGKTPIIPRRSNAIFPGVSDKPRYKTRSAIERFFARIKENKRLVVRFDKLDFTFFSFFALGCLKALNLLC
jgi:transposase